MFVSYRQLIALASAALAIVAVAVAVRVSQSPSLDLRPSTIFSIHRSVPLGPSSSFYSTHNGRSTGGATEAQSTAPSGATNTEGRIPVSPAKPVQPASPVTAEAYLVGDVSTGTIYLERNVSLVLPVASMSKLITALAATDTLSPTTTVTITQADTEVASDTSMLMPGERFSMNELLYPLLLNSSNVAAEALASSNDRLKFLGLMSSYAWEVGMPSTFFADPSGLSPLNISTAHDFFALAQYLYKDRPDILAITRTIATSTATTTDHGAHDFVSIHPFVSDPAFIGGKTGHTPEARDTMLTILRIAGYPIAIIVLASDNRKADTAYLAAEVEHMIATPASF